MFSEGEGGVVENGQVRRHMIVIAVQDARLTMSHADAFASFLDSSPTSCASREASTAR